MLYQLASIDTPADRTAAAVLGVVSELLHVRGDESMCAKQMPFEALISEEAPLTLLTAKRRSTCKHLGVNFHL